MRKGFVTFVNNNQKYLKLNEILVESILSFTELEVEVFSINFDYKHENNRVISKRINVNKECIDTIFYSKIFSSLCSDFDIGLQLDSDMIVTSDAVKIFDKINSDYKYIKGSLHPWNGPLNNSHHFIMNCMGVKTQSQPYIHATYLFTKNSKEFLKEAYDIGMQMFSNNIHPINYDETILNCLLWKKNISDANIECYDPYFEYFKNQIGLKANMQDLIPYGNRYDFHVDSYICHGCKNEKEAQSILLKMKELNNIK